jgi:hypothetical protein
MARRNQQGDGGIRRSPWWCAQPLVASRPIAAASSGARLNHLRNWMRHGITRGAQTKQRPFPSSSLAHALKQWRDWSSARLSAEPISYRWAAISSCRHRLRISGFFSRAPSTSSRQSATRSSSLDPRQFAIAVRGTGHKSATFWLEPLQVGDIPGLDGGRWQTSRPSGDARGHWTSAGWSSFAPKSPQGGLRQDRGNWARWAIRKASRRRHRTQRRAR